MTSIGRRWKGGDARSRAVLIARAFPSQQSETRARGRHGRPAGARPPPLARLSSHSAPRPRGPRAHRQSGGYGGGAPPLPIPNREVKPARADGTAHERGRVGCRHLTRLPDGDIRRGVSFFRPRARPAPQKTQDLPPHIPARRPEPPAAGDGAVAFLPKTHPPPADAFQTIPPQRLNPPM